MPLLSTIMPSIPRKSQLRIHRTERKNKVCISARLEFPGEQRLLANLLGLNFAGLSKVDSDCVSLLLAEFVFMMEKRSLFLGKVAFSCCENRTTLKNARQVLHAQ